MQKQNAKATALPHHENAGSTQDETVFYRLFLEHPHEAGEGYFQHLAFTLKHGWEIIATGFALIAHGLVPSCHTTTASRRIAKLHILFHQRREKGYQEQPD